MDSIAAASMKLTASLTTFACDGALAEAPDLLTHGSLEQRLDGLHCAAADPAMQHGQLAGGGDVGPAEHGRGDITNSALAMALGKLIGERHRDGGHVDVNAGAPARGACEDAAVDQHRARHLIVAQHREYDIAAERLLGAGGDLRAALRERRAGSGERFQTRSACPASSRRPAMALPILPSPMKPMFNAAPAKCPAAAQAKRHSERGPGRVGLTAEARPDT